MITQIPLAFDKAIKICDDSNRAALQAKYLVPPTTHQQNSNRSSGFNEGNQKNNKRKFSSDSRKDTQS